MACAVARWSPVIIFTVMPAPWQAGSPRSPPAAAGRSCPPGRGSRSPPRARRASRWPARLAPGLRREGQHAHPAAGQALDLRRRRGASSGRIPRHGAAPQHHLGRALDQDAPPPLRGRVQRRHELVLGLEGDGVAAAGGARGPRRPSSPTFSAATTSAPSVGSPVMIQLPSGLRAGEASLHRRAVEQQVGHIRRARPRRPPRRAAKSTHGRVADASRPAQAAGRRASRSPRRSSRCGSGCRSCRSR